MRDLELWHRLARGEPVTADELLALAAWPIVRRAPFLGAVVPLAEHAEPVIRGAALRALAGARGHIGVSALVRGLDDDDADVRAAALAALRDTARDAPARYAHAMFHSRVEIRRASLSGPLSQALTEMAIYLRGDAACADLAAAVPWPSG